MTQILNRANYILAGANIGVGIMTHFNWNFYLGIILFIMAVMADTENR